MAKDLPDWKLVQIFALSHIEEVGFILDREKDFHKKVMGERIAVLHLAQANELLMKAFLMKEGYVVDYLRESDVRDGVKVADRAEKSNTLSYRDSLRLVLRHLMKEGQLAESERSRFTEEMIEFYEVRNEIEHSSLSPELEKLDRLKKFYPHMKDLYHIMFAGDELGFMTIKALES